jgi:hypothetical protein
VTAIAAGNKARRSPKPASNVEHLFFGSEVELTKEIFGRLTATDMVLIYRSKIIDTYGIDRLAKRLDATADRSDQVAMRVVLGNILQSWHVRLLNFRLPLEKAHQFDCCF